ncbi:hypothetical protein C8Q78DRAFT_143104 [Trametes maxima]|nr:hypothetical protein C8Q78DRAFT_143104 [Trametes maxima]
MRDMQRGRDCASVVAGHDRHGGGHDPCMYHGDDVRRSWLDMSGAFAEVRCPQQPRPRFAASAELGWLIYALDRPAPPNRTSPVPQHPPSTHPTTLLSPRLLAPMPPKLSVKERAWGTRYDTLESLPPSPPRSAPALSPNSIDAVPLKSENALASPVPDVLTTPDAASHDTSIFVGSLPANMEHTELTSRLTEHLSTHSQVQAIKVVRDSRGGVCAFIQCESPSAASELLHELRVNPPRPFCGRFLRFEAAKAFRTLLVSYRVPKELILAQQRQDGLDSPDRFTGNPKLAHALRIFRPRGTKHLCLSYNSEALSLSRDASVGCAPDVIGDHFDDLGVLINPLKYDEENMRSLVSVFGFVESFEEQMSAPDPESPKTSHVVSTLRSNPHNAPRSLEMSKAVWAVRWKDREDSVLALQTLRRIPHIAVSWAHHHVPSTFSRFDGPLSMSPLTSPVSRREIFDFSNDSPGGRQRLAPRSYGSPLLLPAISPTTPHTDLSHVTPSPPRASTLSPRPRAMPRLDPAASPFECPAETSNRWADQVAELDIDTTTGSMSIPPRMLSPLSGGRVVRDTSSNRVPTTAVEDTGSGHADRQTPASVPMRSGAGAPRRDYKPTNVPRQAWTPTPNGTPTRQPSLSHELSGPPCTPAHRQDAREVDPKTIFVGGLEVEHVDGQTEDRLRRIFDRFGDIDSIQIIKPFNKPNCFAFVKFKSAESASRAILEEHNKTHHGRSLRVQLRDCNPYLRGGWKYGRARGRAAPEDLSCSLQAVEANGDGRGLLTNTEERPNTARVVTMNLPTSRDGVAAPTDVGDASPLETFRPRASLTRSSCDIPSSPSSTSSDTTKVPSVQYDIHAAVPRATPPPPIALRAAAPPPPHPMNMGYVLPQQWIQAYPSPYPYPFQVVPGYPYTGFAYPHMPHAPPALVPDDARRAFPNPNTNPADGAIGSSVVHGSNKAIDNAEPSPSTSSQNGTQPPLRATGFIQNDQGTLIPVYQRDALDQYMANVQGGQAPSNPTASPPAGSAPTARVAWQNPSFPAYQTPYPVGIAPAPIHPPGFQPPLQQGYWFPGSPAYGTPFYPHPHTAGFSHNTLPSAGPAPGPMGRHAQLSPSYGPNQPPSVQRGYFPSTPRRFNRHDRMFGPGTGPPNAMHPPRPPIRSGPTAHAFTSRGP